MVLNLKLVFMINQLVNLFPDKTTTFLCPAFILEFIYLLAALFEVWIILERLVFLF